MKKKLGILVLLVFALGILCMPEAFAAKKATLVAAIESEGVEIYNLGEGNYLLRCDGIPEPVEFPADPFRADPRLRIFDYDQDGEKELAVLVYIGGGTGVSLEDIYFFKKQNGKLVECPYTPEGWYTDLIKKAVGFKTWRENGRMFVEFTSPSDTVRIDVTGDLGQDSPAEPASELKCGDVVAFKLGDNGNITMEAAMGALVNNRYTPDYYADVTAKITFTGGKAALTDVRIVAPK
ncbi:hypothetical protein LJB81_00140 [Desulfovibrio sp. OttesenSCG-928-M14]|nr:hypothetical protein [Desulfovibrio sp. OttesenSCG-928-M14]MDL2291139.1 hypothetical protein [Desulfovibrio sp. OttesenSCG-928-F20]